MDTIITTDYYGNQYKADSDKVQPSIHVYGIVVDGDRALVSPQFDGYDWPGGTFRIGEGFGGGLWIKNRNCGIKFIRCSLENRNGILFSFW